MSKTGKILIKEEDEEGYVRPIETYTDRLTKEEIAEKLIDYVKVDDIFKVPVGSFIRYFTIDNEGNKKFRLGGELISVDGYPNYIRLASGKVKWSVQAKTAIFFRRMDYNEIKKEFEEELKNKDKIIENNEKTIKQLLHKIKTLESRLENTRRNSRESIPKSRSSRKPRP